MHNGTNDGNGSEPIVQLLLVAVNAARRCSVTVRYNKSASILLGSQQCDSIDAARSLLCRAPATEMGRKAAAIDGTDRRTDNRPLHKPCTAYYAGSVNLLS